MAKSEDSGETPTPMELKKLKKAREKLIKLILNELDYALQELDKAPSILFKKNIARAIETIEEAIRIVSFLRGLKEFKCSKEFKCQMSGEIICDPVVVASVHFRPTVTYGQVGALYDEDEAYGAQQRQESEFGEAFGRMTGSIYRRPTIKDTLLFELIGNYIELRDRIRLRVVCPGWNEVVSQKEVYGMFVQTGNLISFFSLKNYFSIFPDSRGFIHDKHFEGGDMVLVTSCQGILCFQTTSGYIIGNHHSEYLALPAQTINHGKNKVVAILCHELGDGDFKLAIAFAIESLNLAFEVYAEGRWFTIVSSIKGPHLLRLRSDGLYHNGSAYFLSEWGCIYKFDLATRASFLL